jgi:hypothetical protein
MVNNSANIMKFKQLFKRDDIGRIVDHHCLSVMILAELLPITNNSANIFKLKQ